MESPNSLEMRPSRMLRKRIDKQKYREENSPSPQRADYSSDTGSQNSVTIKVASVPQSMDSVKQLKTERISHTVTFCRNVAASSINNVVPQDSKHRTYQSKRKMPPHVKGSQLVPISLKRRITGDKKVTPLLPIPVVVGRIKATKSATISPTSRSPLTKPTISASQPSIGHDQTATSKTSSPSKTISPSPLSKAPTTASRSSKSSPSTGSPQTKTTGSSPPAAKKLAPLNVAGISKGPKLPATGQLTYGKSHRRALGRSVTPNKPSPKVELNFDSKPAPSNERPQPTTPPTPKLPEVVKPIVRTYSRRRGRKNLEKLQSATQNTQKSSVDNTNSTARVKSSIENFTQQQQATVQDKEPAAPTQLRKSEEVATTTSKLVAKRSLPSQNNSPPDLDTPTKKRKIEDRNKQKDKESRRASVEKIVTELLSKASHANKTLEKPELITECISDNLVVSLVKLKETEHPPVMDSEESETSSVSNQTDENRSSEKDQVAPPLEEESMDEPVGEITQKETEPESVPIAEDQVQLDESQVEALVNQSHKTAGEFVSKVMSEYQKVGYTAPPRELDIKAITIPRVKDDISTPGKKIPDTNCPFFDPEQLSVKKKEIGITKPPVTSNATSASISQAPYLLSVSPSRGDDEVMVDTDLIVSKYMENQCQFIDPESDNLPIPKDTGKIITTPSKTLNAGSETHTENPPIEKAYAEEEEVIDLTYDSSEELDESKCLNSSDSDVFRPSNKVISIPDSNQSLSAHKPLDTGKDTVLVSKIAEMVTSSPVQDTSSNESKVGSAATDMDQKATSSRSPPTERDDNNVELEPEINTKRTESDHSGEKFDTDSRSASFIEQTESLNNQKGQHKVDLQAENQETLNNAPVQDTSSDKLRVESAENNLTSTKISNVDRQVASSQSLLKESDDSQVESDEFRPSSKVISISDSNQSLSAHKPLDAGKSTVLVSKIAELATSSPVQYTDSDELKVRSAATDMDQKVASSQSPSTERDDNKVELKPEIKSNSTESDHSAEKFVTDSKSASSKEQKESVSQSHSNKEGQFKVDLQAENQETLTKADLTADKFDANAGSVNSMDHKQAYSKSPAMEKDEPKLNLDIANQALSTQTDLDAGKCETNSFDQKEVSSHPTSKERDQHKVEMDTQKQDMSDEADHDAEKNESADRFANSIEQDKAASHSPLYEKSQQENDQEDEKPKTTTRPEVDAENCDPDSGSTDVIDQTEASLKCPAMEEDQHKVDLGENNHAISTQADTIAGEYAPHIGFTNSNLSVVPAVDTDTETRAQTIGAAKSTEVGATAEILMIPSPGHSIFPPGISVVKPGTGKHDVTEYSDRTDSKVKLNPIGTLSCENIEVQTSTVLSVSIDAQNKETSPPAVATSKEDTDPTTVDNKDDEVSNMTVDIQDGGNYQRSCEGIGPKSTVDDSAENCSIAPTTVSDAATAEDTDDCPSEVPTPVEDINCMLQENSPTPSNTVSAADLTIWVVSKGIEELPKGGQDKISGAGEANSHKGSPEQALTDDFENSLATNHGAIVDDDSSSNAVLARQEIGVGLSDSASQGEGHTEPITAHSDSTSLSKGTSRNLNDTQDALNTSIEDDADALIIDLTRDNEEVVSLDCEMTAEPSITVTADLGGDDGPPANSGSNSSYEMHMAATPDSEGPILEIIQTNIPVPVVKPVMDNVVTNDSDIQSGAASIDSIDDQGKTQKPSTSQPYETSCNAEDLSSNSQPVIEQIHPPAAYSSASDTSIPANVIASEDPRPDISEIQSSYLNRSASSDGPESAKKDVIENDKRQEADHQCEDNDLQHPHEHVDTRIEKHEAAHMDSESDLSERNCSDNPVLSVQASDSHSNAIPAVTMFQQESDTSDHSMTSDKMERPGIGQGAEFELDSSKHLITGNLHESSVQPRLSAELLEEPPINNDLSTSHQNAAKTENQDVAERTVKVVVSECQGKSEPPKDNLQAKTETSIKQPDAIEAAESMDQESDQFEQTSLENQPELSAITRESPSVVTEELSIEQVSDTAIRSLKPEGIEKPEILKSLEKEKDSQQELITEREIESEIKTLESLSSVVTEELSIEQVSDTAIRSLKPEGIEKPEILKSLEKEKDSQQELITEREIESEIKTLESLSSVVTESSPIEHEPESSSNHGSYVPDELQHPKEEGIGLNKDTSSDDQESACEVMVNSRGSEPVPTSAVGRIDSSKIQERVLSEQEACESKMFSAAASETGMKSGAQLQIEIPDDERHDHNDFNVNTHSSSVMGDPEFDDPGDMEGSRPSFGYDDDDSNPPGDIWPSLASSPSSSDQSDRDIDEDVIHMDIGEQENKNDEVVSQLSEQSNNHTDQNNLPASNALVEGMNTLRLPSTSGTSVLPESNEPEDPSDVGAKKPVTEVCACDTTTSLAEDDPLSKRTDNQTPPESNGSQPADVTLDQPRTGKLGRREWGKELTKIRMKLLEKKRQQTQARLQRAMQSRRKSLNAKLAAKAKLAETVDIYKGESSIRDSAISLQQSPSRIKESPTNKLVQTTEHIESVLTASEIHTLTQSADAKSGAERQPTPDLPALSMDNIEIVEDDEDDEPWPFETSPLESESDQSQDAAPVVTVESKSRKDLKPHKNSKPPKVLKPLTSEARDISSKHSSQKIVPATTKPVVAAIIEANTVTASPAGLQLIKQALGGTKRGQYKEKPKSRGTAATAVKPLQKILPKPPSSPSNESSAPVEQDTPVSKGSNKKSATARKTLSPSKPKPSSQHASPSISSPALLAAVTTKVTSPLGKTVLPSPVMTTTSIAALPVFTSPKSANFSPVIPLRPKVPATPPSNRTAVNISFSADKTPDQAHAKMRSVERQQALIDSRWKDMFNSEVEPLDFDEPASKKKKTDEILPKAFKASSELIKGTQKTASVSYQNTPCGDSYPIVDTPAIKPITADDLILCSCKLTGIVSPNKDKVKIMFCQAIDTVGKSIVNCVSRVTEKMEVRSSAKLPHLVLCKYHRKKLANHASCPVCGLFCSGGEFMDCTNGKGHLHHEACQVKDKDGSYLCPHCGERSLQVKQQLTHKRKTDNYKATKSSNSKKDGGEGIARMCIRLVSKPASQAEQASSSYDNKLFEVSKSKLLDGVEKTKLINIMSSLEHLVPLMHEKLASVGATAATSVTVPSTLYNLSSYILKNDLSQLVLAICEVIKRSEIAGATGKFPLDFQFNEQGGKTLLHLSIMSSSLATVHCLVMAGVALNSTDNKGVTPLMMAAKGHHLDILKYLIGAGASVDLRDVDGMTALHLAAVAGNTAICEYLLKDVHVGSNCTDEGGWTPLVWAIENGHTNVVKLLLGCGADIHLRDSEGNVSIHWGAYSGNTEIIKLLVAKGADLESVNELGDRPLHIAVRQARTDAVILLLSHGADTSAINNLHETPAECCHGACSDNMKSFLQVNHMLRSCKIAGLQTKSSKLLHQDIARGKERMPIPVTNDADNTNYPTDFVYVTESVWTSPVPINTTISSLSSCNCGGDCTRATCTCIRSSVSCWYAFAGVLSEDFDYNNPPQLFECNKACGCWNTCSNRVVQQGITAQLELFKTKHRGWGVKARHDIVKGQFVCEYVGELITDSQADEREDDSYLFDLDYKDGDTYCMDAKNYGNISRFVNHRCEPNLTPVSVFIEHQDIRFPRICLFANTDIPQGTELGFDYGEKFWLVKYKHFLCDCGCASCKYNKETINQTLAQHQLSPESGSSSKDT